MGPRRHFGLSRDIVYSSPDISSAIRPRYYKYIIPTFYEYITYYILFKKMRLYDIFTKSLK